MVEVTRFRSILFVVTMWQPGENLKAKALERIFRMHL